jgi:hypothetical protein
MFFIKTHDQGARMGTWRNVKESRSVFLKGQEVKLIGELQCIFENTAHVALQEESLFLTVNSRPK